MEAPSSEPLPAARVEPAPRRSWAWVAPVLALLFVVALLVRAERERGIPLTVHFADGRGLAVGDALRHRGITVGRVSDVRLTADFAGVDVAVELDRSAAGLARSGSRFWVVRPRIEPEGISGLDTIVGARYLGVLPGPLDAAAEARFVGLEEEPVSTPPGALEVLLEADGRGGLRRGAPVTWRGTTVGRVLSVGLSGDARRVEARAAIDPGFAPLVLETSRFWETSGLRLDLGLGGLDLELDSLQALLAGGVAFATPEEPAPPARNGQRFHLSPTADEDWLEWHPALAVGQVGLPSGLAAPRPERARLTWESGLFQRNKAREGWVLWTEDGLLGPADLLCVPEGAQGDPASLEASGARHALAPSAPGGEALLLPDATPGTTSTTPWPRARMRRPEAPETCLAIGDPALAPLALDPESLAGGALPWAVDGSLPLDASWHGAPVVSRTDGALLGLLLVTDDGARVVATP